MTQNTVTLEREVVEALLRRGDAERDSRLTPQAVAQKLCSEEAREAVLRACFEFPDDPDTRAEWMPMIGTATTALANLFTGEGRAELAIDLESAKAHGVCPACEGYGEEEGDNPCPGCGDAGTWEAYQARQFAVPTKDNGESLRGGRDV